MDFRILGSLEVWDGERQLELGGQKRRAVLAFLLLHANEVVAADRLVDQLWGEKAPRNAAGALQTHVSRLRKELGAEVLARQAWGYVLRTEPGALDLERFELLTAEAENLPARERAEKLREALSLWRGPPLGDLAFEPALAGDIARLEELRLTVLENRIDADLESGSQAGLVGELEALIADQPLRERLRGQLILALYRGGRQAEALEVYRETRRVLADELGLEPSPELRELERAILQQDPALRATPVSTAMASEQGVRPGRRRRVFIGASVALLLAALGGVTAYALTSSTTLASQGTAPPALCCPLSLLVLPGGHTTGHQTTGRATTTHGKTTTTKTNSGTTRNGNGKTTTTRPTVSSSIVTPPPATTAITTTTTTGKPKLVRLVDDFSRPALDPRIWTTWSTGTGATYDQASGQGVFSIAGDATFDPQADNASANIVTKCAFPGDFQARIDFGLGPWPGANGAAISLNAVTGGSNATVELIQRVTAPWGDGYKAWPNGGLMPLQEQRGSLRLTRRSGVIRASFSHNKGWTVIGRKQFVGRIRLDIGISTFQNDWQGQDVEAAVNNFRNVALHADCPPGSDPRRR
jgi:DNA-binding SARP family transcriptional activator